MKVTEQKTKSLTFIFNKDEEYSSFVDILNYGVSAIPELPDSAMLEVMESIKRNVFAGHPFVSKITISDENGPYFENGQGQWTSMPQGTGGSPVTVKMPTYIV